jgi:hypothetical protein
MYLALDLYAVTRGIGPENHCNRILACHLKLKLTIAGDGNFPAQGQTQCSPVNFATVGFFSVQ